MLTSLFTERSKRAYRAAHATHQAKGKSLLATYHQDRDHTLNEYPHVARWHEAFENFDFATASDRGLLRQLKQDGFLEEQLPVQSPEAATFRYSLISPRILDVERLASNPAKVSYAFTNLKFCIRRSDESLKGVAVPGGWKNVALVDSEIFEIPQNVSPDNFDDMEKIHVYYLVGEVARHVFAHQDRVA
jgi:hypothetical protein